MRKRIFLCLLLLSSLAGGAWAQEILTDPLLFVFKLHGQTRKYRFTFQPAQDTLYLHWGIERNTKWQSGSYAMLPTVLKTATRLSFLQPEDGKHVCLPSEETFALISHAAWQQLKTTHAFRYNETEYRLADTVKQAAGYPLLHVKDEVDGCEMWVMDNPDFPVIWEMRNNPLGINWKVDYSSTSVRNLKEEILQSPEKMGSIYYAYPHPEGTQTPAPEGYIPFYASHYGRHGSRWMTSDERYLEVIRVFDDFHARSGLTALGEDVRLRLQEVWKDAQGRGGQLTPLGERQHKAIARRLYRHYPQIFRQDSAAIDAFSSTSIRCIMSMAAFTEQLKEMNPSLQVTREANERTMKYIAYTSPEAARVGSDSAAWRKDFHAFQEAHIHPGRLIASLFKHPEEVPAPRELMMGLYWIASDMQDVELSLSFYDIFEKEELFAIWQSINYRMYICNANAPVNEGAAARSAVSLLRNIIKSADRAICEGKPCATLRFGHDTNLIRLLALMQVEGCCNQETDPDRYYVAWQDFRVAPMGANLQLIFFRNKEGEVIVKLLHNENEVKLPIDSPIAPYYKWETVKAFYNHL